ncbi:hypothetical protein L0F63_007483, partial [Massospora cicadina]
MLEGEVRCGTSLFDFSVLGSLTEKSSDLVQMSPWSLSQGGRVPMRLRTRGLLAPVPHRSSSGFIDEISSVVNSRILIEG